MKKIILIVFVSAFLLLAVTSCEEGARYITNKVIEEVIEVDTIISDISNQGKPWEIIDSLLTELDSLKIKLYECEQL